MLLREAGDAVIVIGQPAHAWVSGQLARAWGNDRFASPAPREEVWLAAEQHDTGMADWDLEPTLNPETGRPHAFMELPLETHLALWTAGPRRVLAQSRYAALLVSMHGSGLYGRRNLDDAPPEEAAAIRAFLEERRIFERDLSAGLVADPAVGEAAAPEAVARNSRLVWAWDALSLALLLRWAPYRTEEVPAGATDRAALELRPAGAEGRFTLEPWPFAGDRLRLRCEGRRLHGRYTAQGAMRAALAQARWCTLEFELVPAGAK